MEAAPAGVVHPGGHTSMNHGPSGGPSGCTELAAGSLAPPCTEQTSRPSHTKHAGSSHLSSLAKGSTTAPCHKLPWCHPTSWGAGRQGKPEGERGSPVSWLLLLQGLWGDRWLGGSLWAIAEPLAGYVHPVGCQLDSPDHMDTLGNTQ